MVTDKQNDIAAEYVLGTLQGNARLQFEQLLREDADMRQHVHDWEERLFCLTEGIAAVKPKARVWENINQRINPLVSKTEHGRLFWWRAWGMIASVMLLVLSVYLVQIQPSTDTSLPTLAVLNNRSSQAGWLVQASYKKQAMTIQALTVVNPGRGKAYELWMLPKDGAPRSLGLLPLTGSRSLTLTHEKLSILKNSTALAVSLEPAGGSPTGSPTGPVDYQGRILNI